MDGGRLRVDRAGCALVDRHELSVNPVSAQAGALREAIQTIPVDQSIVVGALPGQTVVIRYPRLQEMPEGQLAQSIEAEAGQSIPYDLSAVFMDWTVLGRLTEGEQTLLKILLVAAKHEVIETRVQIAEAAQVVYFVLGVDSLALADAAECCDFLRVGESVALVNLGATSTSIHFTKDGVSNFIRDVSWGGRELIQAIAKARRCEYGDAENVLLRGGVDEPASGAVPPPGQGPDEGGAEPPGGSLLGPLDEELGGVDEQGPLSARPPMETERGTSDILVAPLAHLVAEVRRSFDYYEQQLYERPVDRVILSGGVAQLPLVRDTLVKELDFEKIEVADPTLSALLVDESSATAAMMRDPAQFMVAVGLAARGAAEL